MSAEPHGGPAGQRGRTTPRWVLHADMDCFFAAVEVLRRPELAGRPVLVGGARWQSLHCASATVPIQDTVVVVPR